MNKSLNLPLFCSISKAASSHLVCQAMYYKIFHSFAPIHICFSLVFIEQNDFISSKQ